MRILNTRKTVRIDPRKVARLWRALVGRMRAHLDGYHPVAKGDNDATFHTK